MRNLGALLSLQPLREQGDSVQPCAKLHEMQLRYKYYLSASCHVAEDFHAESAVNSDFD